MRSRVLVPVILVSVTTLLHSCVSPAMLEEHVATVDQRLATLEDLHQSELSSLQRQLETEAANLEAEVERLNGLLVEIRESTERLQQEQSELETDVLSRTARSEARADELAERVGNIRLKLLQIDRERSRRQRP